MVDFETFKNAIESVKRYYEKIEKLTKILKVEGIIPPNDMNYMIEFVIKACHDEKNRWIDYYIHELDFGKKYTNGCITSKIGDEFIWIKLRTTRDLYNFILNNYNESLKKGK